jgi:hypothetical protein
MKKSQITTFVILGLVLLIIFSFLLVIKDTLEKDNKTLEKTSSLIKSNALKNNFESCLSTLGLKSVSLAAENGGYIYSYQGGNIRLGLNKDYLNHTLYNNKMLFLDYGINVNNSLKGNLSIIKLCYDQTCSSQYHSDNVRDTIQAQIENYIYKNINSCLNFTQLEETYGAKIIIQSNFTSKASISDDQVILNLNMPLLFDFKDKDPVIESFEYSTEIPVRLGETYKFAHDLLLRDVSSDFDMENDFIISKFFKEGFSVDILDSNCINCNLPKKEDYILEIKDSKSLIDYKPLIFRSVIKNRPPVIEEISDYTIDVSNSNDPRSIEIDFVAFDPENSKLNLFFLGQGENNWKQTEFFASSNSQLLLDQGTLKLNIIPSKDYGTHKVGILAIDETGLFDVEFFNIEVIDNTKDNTPESYCLNSGCSWNNANKNKWCFLYSNFCNSECSSVYDGSSFDCFDNKCSDCIENLYNSEEYFIDLNTNFCDQSTKTDCNAKNPDCFWVTENSTNTYQSSCFSDKELLNLPNFSYIDIN